VRSIYDDGWGRCRLCRDQLTSCRCGITHYCPDCSEGSFKCKCDGPNPAWRKYVRRATTAAHQAADHLVLATGFAKRQDFGAAARHMWAAAAKCGQAAIHRKRAELCKTTN
jgi:hypothetical protein